MTHDLSAEQVLERNREAMGEDLGTLYTVLEGELVWLHWQWHEFIELYGTKPTRLDVLNLSAPFFFSLLQRMFWHDTILGLSRLAGPTKSLNKSNLTFQRLPPLIHDPQLREKVKLGVADFVSKAAFARDWRNRHLAHRDLGLALNQGAEPLLAATRKDVENCLAVAADVLNNISHHFSDATTAYTVGPMQDGAQALMYVLRDGLRREDERRAILDRGECRPDLINDDFEPL